MPARCGAGNRRTTDRSHPLSGGLTRCAHCGFAITGELIKRKLKSGGVRTHLYYRCGNNSPEDGHPTVRWREDDLEQAILDELTTLRMPSSELAEWFKGSLVAMFADVEDMQRRHMQMLTKRRTEIENMKDRLLTCYLSGAVEDDVFQAKMTELKRELAEVEESLEKAARYDPKAPRRALAVFEFSQNLAGLWQRSNSAAKREILECVSLNRAVSDATLCVEKRKPFDFIAERPFFNNGRLNCQSFEPNPEAIAGYLPAFIGPPLPHIVTALEFAESLK